MSWDAIIGICSVGGSLIVLTVLVFRCRQIVNRMAKVGPRSARQGLKELNGDR